jgi:hypothetical protein
MRPIRTPAGVRCAHFFYCNHNIRGSGLKWKNRWPWLYDALIICCVARIVAASDQHIQTYTLSNFSLCTVSQRKVVGAASNSLPEPEPHQKDAAPQHCSEKNSYSIGKILWWKSALFFFYTPLDVTYWPCLVPSAWPQEEKSCLE